MRYYVDGSSENSVAQDVGASQGSGTLELRRTLYYLTTARMLMAGADVPYRS